MCKGNSSVWSNKTDLLPEGSEISCFLIVFFRLNNGVMTHAQGTTLVSEKYADIKTRVIKVNQHSGLKYIEIIILVDPIVNAE